ncbi:sensor histidine kinase [Actinocorallia populi]|uniref:sensor histidine kinase n=1 Tax=Actinocorallia populi TaxID=2079200 RepID=UPI001E435951|nr:HAMP domain-containing sensor histidine kinase [Actinocorallia populi]
MNLSSVRARTTLGATAVVALVLAVTGLIVVLSLRSDLVHTADLEAEVSARRVASQIAGGVAFGDLRLPDEDEPVQVIGPGGRVVAATEDLSSVAAGGQDRTRRDDLDDDDDEDGDPGRGEVSTNAVFSTREAVIDGVAGEYRFAAVEATAPDGTTVLVYAGTDLTTTRNAVSATVRTMLLGLPPVLLVVAVATWLVTRRALRPVEAIRGEMASITEAGDLARRVPVPDSRDEIARLAATTNRTLAALESSVEQQRRFVADASHELRNPIASLRAQLEIALEHRELLDLPGAVEDVHRLQQLTTDLLFLARADAGEARPPASEISLTELVAGELAARPDADRVPITVDLAEDVRVQGHPRQLARALSNLVDNAQRHAHSEVSVALHARGGRAVLRVADDGEGVPPADRERIFGRFVRRDDARTRDEGGAGLGLPIAREIVVSHGGTLRAVEPAARGAVFEITLPLNPAVPAEG